MPKPVNLYLPKTEDTPDPEVEKRTRHTFSAKYKLRVIAEAAQCRHGELDALLRRENIYSNQLQNWRRQLAAGGEQPLSKTAPGPRPKSTLEQRQIEKHGLCSMSKHSSLLLDAFRGLFMFGQGWVKPRYASSQSGRDQSISSSAATSC
jgi:transposase-like protein